MRMNTRRLLIYLVLLLPSAQFAWVNRAMPQFAYLHDDGLLFVTAQSVAAGHYSIPSLPEDPSQTKFPPLHPLFLSTIWRMNPNFPANLSLATLLSWLVLTACLALAWKLYSRYEALKPRVWLLLGLLGLNPYFILFGCSMFSEVFFTCWVLAALLAVSRGGLRMTILAGLLAGGAYLSRSAGIALLVSVPATLAWKRDWRRAAVFIASMLPAVAGWMWWARTHTLSHADPTLIYYTDYLRYQFLNVGLDNLPVVLWKNLDQMLYGMGSMVLPKVVEMLPIKVLTEVIAVAMIAGTVRLARRGIAVDYGLFALVSMAILVVWHFPPNERFIVPLFPLLLAGLVTEIEHIGRMLKLGFRHKDFGQRAVAGVLAAGVVAILSAALALQFYVTFVYLHESAGQKISKLRDQRAAYTWISAHLPRSATVLSYDDPLLYLYTGRRGNYLPLLPRWWYREDHAAIVGAYRDLPGYCRSRGLQYVYFTSEDLEREVGDEDRREIVRVVAANPELTPIFQAGIGTIYKVAAARPH